MIIGNANAIINNVDAALGTEADKQFIKAQALTYRAYCYMMLAQLYGNRWSESNNGTSAGLVLRTTSTTGDLPKSTLLETYNLIYGDLTSTGEAVKGTELSNRALSLYPKLFSTATAFE
jgi:hypothetical protein